jgi:hypothetical protein
MLQQKRSVQFLIGYWILDIGYWILSHDVDYAI